MSHFLFADSIHLHSKNFGSLFSYIESKRISVTFHQAHEGMKSRLGDYVGAPGLLPYRMGLKELDRQQLFDLTHNYKNKPIRLFPLCKAECLAYSLAKSTHWVEEPMGYLSAEIRERALFDRLYDEERDLLLGNMAAARFWINAWQHYFEEHPSGFSHAFGFSGSFIYTRVLMEICSWSRTRMLVLESTFTGRDYYLEERYSPIANRSDIRLQTVRNAKALPTDSLLCARESAKAINKVFSSKNKNVKQPSTADLLAFEEPSRPTLLVIGQVVNDFSVIEQRAGWISSINFYKSLIERALRETDYNIVFKGHPWEHKKTHVQSPLTKGCLESFRESLPSEYRARFVLRENDNLVMLGDFADRVVLLNSQSGIEVALHCGLRPSTFGSPYYGNAGFSDDYRDLDTFFADVKSGRTQALLDLDSFEALKGFLTRFLQYHTVSEFPSGLRRIKEVLEVRAPIMASDNQQEEDETVLDPNVIIIPKYQPQWQKLIRPIVGDKRANQLGTLSRDPVGVIERQVLDRLRRAKLSGN